MEKSSSMFKGTLPQVIAAFAGSVSAISDGMHYGWTAPVIPILKSPDSHIKISDSDESWLETMYMIGGITGLPVTILLVDRVGRKNLTLTASILGLLAWMIIALAPNAMCLYIARFSAGMAGDIAFVATPMYVAEIANEKIRGLLNSLIYLMLLTGIVLIYAIAPFTPFYGPSAVGVVLLVVQIGVFVFMPKSPYFLLTKNKIESAVRSLNQLRTTRHNEHELEEISRAIERQKEEEGRPQDLILVKSNRKALLVTTVLNIAQHFGGISVMLMNMHTILEDAGAVYLEPSTTAIMFSVLMLMAATVSSLCVDRYGRRFLLVTSTSLTGICLLSLAIYFNFKNLDFDMKSVSWIPVACVMFYAIAFKIGLGIVPVVLNAELFSNKVKAIGMTVSEVMYLFIALIAIEVFKGLDMLYGSHVPFYLFAAISFMSALFCTFGIPETKGKTLDEIQVLLRGKSTGAIKDTDYDGLLKLPLSKV